MAERSLAERYKAATLETIDHRSNINDLEYAAKAGSYAESSLYVNGKEYSRNVYYATERAAINAEREGVESASAEDMLAKRVQQRRENIEKGLQEALEEINNPSLTAEEKEDYQRYLDRYKKEASMSDEQLAELVVERQEENATLWRISERSYSLASALEVQGKAFDELQYSLQNEAEELGCEAIVDIDMEKFASEVKASPEFKPYLDYQRALKAERVIDTVGAGAAVVALGSMATFLTSVGLHFGGVMNLDAGVGSVIGGASASGMAAGALSGIGLNFVSKAMSKKVDSVYENLRKNGQNILKNYLDGQDKVEMGE